MMSLLDRLPRPMFVLGVYVQGSLCQGDPVDTVGEREVRILLECFLVLLVFL